MLGGAAKPLVFLFHYPCATLPLPFYYPFTTLLLPHSLHFFLLPTLQFLHIIRLCRKMSYATENNLRKIWKIDGGG